MSELVVVGFSEEHKAQEVWDTIRESGQAHLVDFDDGAVMIRRVNGHVEVRAGHRPLTEAVSWAHLWGFLASLIFIVPVVGIAAISINDAFNRAVASSSISESLRDQLRDLVGPGSSALLAIVRSADTSAVVNELEPYGGKVLRIPLSDKDVAVLQDAIHSRGVIS